MTTNDNMTEVTNTFLEADRMVQKGTNELRDDLRKFEAILKQGAASFSSTLGKNQIIGLDAPELYTHHVKEQVGKLMDGMREGMKRINATACRFQNNMKAYTDNKDEDLVLISYTRGKTTAKAKSKPKAGPSKQVPELTSSDKPMAVGKKTGGLKRKRNEAPKAAPISKPIDNLKVCGKVTIGERKFCMVEEIGTVTPIKKFKQ